MERFPLPRETPEAGVSQAAGLSEGCTLLSPCCSATLPCVNCKVFPVQPEHSARKASGGQAPAPAEPGTVALWDRTALLGRSSVGLQQSSLGPLANTRLFITKAREPKRGQRLEKPV